MHPMLIIYKVSSKFRVSCIKSTIKLSTSTSSFSEETTSYYGNNVDNRYDDAWSSSFTPSSGLGVLRSNEADDIDILVKNYTAPALAQSLREREHALQRAAVLLEHKSFGELKALLAPYSRESVEARRRRRDRVDASGDKGEDGLSKKQLAAIQRFLHRMPRYVSKPVDRRASVIIPLCNVNGVASILFQKRSEKVRTHKQQVCFPGGMVDEGVDTTIIETSLREFEEEMGVSGDKVRVLGILRCDWTEVQNMTGVAVTPVVGFLGEMNDLALRPNPDEVQYLFTVPLSDLLDDSKWTLRPFSTPVFSGGDSNEVIWGLTAYLLNRFLKDVLLKCSAHKEEV